MDQYLAFKLEELSNKIREILQIKEEQLINIDYLETLISKINETFSDLKIEKGYNMEFNMKDGKFITINFSD